MGWPIPATVPADTELAVTSGLRSLLSPAVVATDEVGWQRGEQRVVVTVLAGIPRGPRGQVPVNLVVVAGSKDDASELARAAHAAMLGLTAVTSGVQAVSASTLPYPIPSVDTLDGIARYSASYLVLVSSTPA